MEVQLKYKSPVDTSKIQHKLLVSTTITGMSERAQEKQSSHTKSPEGSKFKRIDDYDYFINAKSKRRKPSALREITKTISKMPPDSIKFAVGVPNVSTFPFQEVSIKLKDGVNFKIEGQELEAALQYMPTTGYAPLINQLQEIQDRTHGPQDWNSQSILVTCGSNEPVANIFEMVLNDGDPVILPIPVYPATADLLRQYNADYIALEQDKDGVQPDQLRKILQDRVQQQKPVPKLMYINPTACNPTGRNLSVERKQEIYRTACEYNFLIMEDDPYYFLHFMDENSPSFLSMDVEGRVVRLDSFSKILSSGLRVGYITGPNELVRRIELHLQVTTLHTSALSQVLINKLLEYWGYEQYMVHLEQVKKFYRERRDIMVDACDRYLKGLAEWHIPMGGMFLWLKIPVLKDTWSLAVERCQEKGLLILPGHPFTGDLLPAQYNYVRLSFSLADPSQMDEGIKLLSEAIQEMKINS